MGVVGLALGCPLEAGLLDEKLERHGCNCGDYAELTKGAAGQGALKCSPGCRFPLRKGGVFLSERRARCVPRAAPFRGLRSWSGIVRLGFSPFAHEELARFVVDVVELVGPLVVAPHQAAGFHGAIAIFDGQDVQVRVEPRKIELPCPCPSLFLRLSCPCPCPC